MSVAFRRDSDEEHREPVFELPIPPGPNLVTRRGLAQIEARVATMEADLLDETARELRYWRQRLATAQLGPLPPADEIAFGSRVRFRLDGREKQITIVGDDEADAHAGLIAFQAPLARALIGAGEGDLLPFAGREDAIEVLELLSSED
jgi:transcription elongation GreA/GreB family factor